VISCQEKYKSYRCLHEATVDKGGAAILKVRGTKHDLRAERAKKNFFLYPHFSKCGGYNQANVSFEYTEICYLVVALQWRIQASADQAAASPLSVFETTAVRK